MFAARRPCCTTAVLRTVRTVCCLRAVLRADRAIFCTRAVLFPARGPPFLLGTGRTFSARGPPFFCAWAPQRPRTLVVTLKNGVFISCSTICPRKNGGTATSNITSGTVYASNSQKRTNLDLHKNTKACRPPIKMSLQVSNGTVPVPLRRCTFPPLLKPVPHTTPMFAMEEIPAVWIPLPFPAHPDSHTEN